MHRVTVLLVLFLLLVPGQRQVFAKGPSLAALNVQLADLPPGSHLVTDQRLTTTAAVAQADSADLSAYLKAGIVRANERTFHSGSTKRQVTVLANVYLLKSAAAAHGFYSREVHSVPGNIHAASLGPVGDEGRDLSGPGTVNGKRVPVDVAIFRRGAYVGLVGLGPVSAAFPASEVKRLAMAVDGRLQHA